jgi:polar amino acid transport system permease protein
MSTLSISHFYLFLTGLGWTLFLASIGFVGGAVGGLVVALCRTSANRIVRNIAWGFIEVFRGTPLLMQLFVAYYGVALMNFDISPWAAVGVGLTLHASAFLGDIWRGSIQALPLGQVEAANALGLNYWSRTIYIILPQAFKTSLPATVGFLVQLLKGTSLAAIVGFTELSRTGTIVSNLTFQPLLVYGIVGVLYFVMCWPLSQVGRQLEKRLAGAVR